jgi:hypothetical protein
MNIHNVTVRDENGRVLIECGVSNSLIAIFTAAMSELGYTITEAI